MVPESRSTKCYVPRFAALRQFYCGFALDEPVGFRPESFNSG